MGAVLETTPGGKRVRACTREGVRRDSRSRKSHFPSLWPRTCLDNSCCIQLALVFRLGVGDVGLIIKREHYEEIVSASVPFPNDDDDTAGRSRSRSFVIPHHLTVEGNRLANPGEALRQTVNIPAAVVGQELVFVIVDCSRSVRLKLVALDRGWIPDDLLPDSEVRP